MRAEANYAFNYSDYQYGTLDQAVAAEKTAKAKAALDLFELPRVVAKPKVAELTTTAPSAPANDANKPGFFERVGAFFKMIGEGIASGAVFLAGCVMWLIFFPIGIYLWFISGAIGMSAGEDAMIAFKGQRPNRPWEKLPNAV